MVRILILWLIYGVIITTVACTRQDGLPCGYPGDNQIAGNDSVIWELMESKVIFNTKNEDGNYNVAISNPTQNNILCLYRNKTYKATDTVAALLGISSSGNWSNVVGDADYRNDAITIDNKIFPSPGWCNSGYRSDNRETLNISRYQNKWTDSTITFAYYFLRIN